MTTTRHPAPGATAPTRRAWLSLLGFVPSFGLAFLVGEGLVSAMGYDVGSDQPPWPVAVAAVVPALLVFALPAIAAVHFGRQALRLGDRRARVPMTIAVVVATAFVLTNALAPLLGG
ncbi:hypothetical protein ASG76_05480 [Nocardioides sp. Soil774]|uniref:hypothetical protein n=1 Tax=Nocardioides sp. Soil774 TaxID=1736408 RepID=UPI0006F446B3|nr:hypothetical protein [Nocardioides sp. Soil774]KRE95136.1 hypothetical protein ASG76_05480 [Nocardioides sp. Soil774]